MANKIIEYLPVDGSRVPAQYVLDEQPNPVTLTTDAQQAKQFSSKVVGFIIANLNYINEGDSSNPITPPPPPPM